MNSIGVFCGSTLPKQKEIIQVADELGARIAKLGASLVYSCAKVGLMGAVSKSCSDHQGKVIGIIPDFLAKDQIAHLTITKLYSVRSFQERRLKFAKLSDAFIFLPGGLGTMHDLTEWVQLKRLGILTQPMVCINTAGFFDSINDLFQRLLAEELITDDFSELIKIVDTIDEAIDFLQENQSEEPFNEELLEQM